MSKETTIRVLSPVGEVRNAQVTVPALPGDLAGRTVGFLDNTKANFDRLVGFMGEMLTERFGVRAVVHLKKANASVPAAPEILAELAKQCDVVFAGSAD
ncbi:MAG: hypothetical protein ACE5JD_17200 [Candidatus Methylomirabilia bacterium]